MIRIARARSVLLAAFALLVFATSVHAQFPGGGGPGGGGGRGGMGGRDGMMRAPNREASPAGVPSAVPQVQLDQLEDELKLTASQRPLWNAFADKVAKLMDDVGRARQPGAPQPENAVGQLDRLTDLARNRLASLEDIADAARRLYPQLTSEQQSIADRRIMAIVAPAIGDARTASAGTRPPARP